MRRKLIRPLSIALITALLICEIPSVSLTAFAESTGVETANITTENGQSYQQYLDGFRQMHPASESVTAVMDRAVGLGADVTFKDNAVSWNNGTGELNFNVDVAQTGLYNIVITWQPADDGTDLNLGLKIDGNSQFSALGRLVLNREWKNATDAPHVDDQGNEYAQEQVETGMRISTMLHDDTGVVVDPYRFGFTSGSHVITLVEPQQSVNIYSIELCPPEQAKDYRDVSASYKIESSDADIVTVQGESASLKTTNSIIPKSNNSDCGMTPVNPYKTKINYIGSTSWQSPGERLTWNFHADTSGYYYMNIRYKQSDLVNGQSLRWLKLDNRTPFTEAKELRFPYGTSWKNYTFSDSDSTPYYLWIEKGDHTISMEVTLGEQSQYFDRLSGIVNTLGNEYIKMIMITGETPDVNRDYELFKQIPDFTETLTDTRDSLDALVSDMRNASGSNETQAVAAMKNMSRILDNMIKSPYIAQQYISDYYSNYTSVSAWLYDMKKMPLSIDQIQFVPANQKNMNSHNYFFKNISYWAIRLVSSFTNDYSFTNKNDPDENTIRLWVGWGQDQAGVLNSLIKDSFTPETGIKVNLEIVSASLINGILSGNFPDMILQMSRTDPVNLGIRGAVADLTQFDDCDEILKRFQPGAEVPYKYHDALYALPDTQSYFLMFYRADIFKDLNLDIPNTWDEFIHAATIIQRNNMSVYVPYTQIESATTVNAGVGNLHLFPTLMCQNGLSLYNDTLDATNLVSKAAINVFDDWVKFYMDYNYFKQADFYNRFRVGVMPLGIATMSTYLTLCSAAPEIKGRWSVALVPGTADESGTINRKVSGGGTGCSIVEQSTHKQQAWEFLKWWTSDKTQTRYSNNVESILGTISRISTSNINAFKSLSWNKQDLKVFLQEWDQVSEIPEVPGSYYVSRAIDQAFWAVINGGGTTKDAVVEWSSVADNEISRKIKEYSPREG